MRETLFSNSSQVLTLACPCPVRMRSLRSTPHSSPDSQTWRVFCCCCCFLITLYSQMKPGFRVFLSFKFLVSFTVIPLSQRSTKNNFREKDEMCDVS